MASLSPAGAALYTVGDTVAVIKFVLFRMLAFSILFIISSDAFSLDFTNPYFLIASSSISLLFLHLVYVQSPRFGLFRYLWGSVMILGLIPLVFFEVLLFVYSLSYLLVDVLVGIILLTEIRKTFK